MWMLFMNLMILILMCSMIYFLMNKIFNKFNNSVEEKLKMNLIYSW